MVHKTELGVPDQSDDTWTFTTPSPAIWRAPGKHISFTDKITLQIASYPKNRILHLDDPSKFILTSFGDFKLDAIPSVRRDYMIRFLTKGLTLDGVHYRFYGHSNSQLRSRSCFLREATTDRELDERISRLGQFDKILNVAKRAKRIGLLFSSAPIDWTLHPQYTKDIPDIRSGEELFSDGCGLISKHLAMQLSRKKNIKFHGKNYTPCVFQIRYKGYKGVLMLHPDLDKERQAFVHFRASQKKFTATGDDIFSVVEYSAPYVYGRLNDDVLVLLASLGITNEKFLAKQTEYFNLIQAAGASWERAFDFLSGLGRVDSAEKLLLDGLDSPQIQSEIRKLQSVELASLRKKSDESQFRTRMLVHKSRLLFGVCDPYEVLREGEVFVRISVPHKGATTLTHIDLLVVRNPCLHPGDCLKLRAVNHPRLSHLVDCIVFPTVGRRAAPSMSSGGDLDGDKYLVIFDPDLVPAKVAESYTYPGVKEHTQAKVTREDLAKHFASYNNSSLARIVKLHSKWVRCSPDGAMSSQCQELNALHSLAVDGGRVRIPERLKEPPTPQEPYILDILSDAAKVFAQNGIQTAGQLSPSTPMTTVDSLSLITHLLSSEKYLGSEYELVTLARAIARKNNIDFRRFWAHVDVSALTAMQKLALSFELGLTPVEEAYLWNSLIRSDIVRPVELMDPVLGAPLRLQRLYSSQIQGRAAFFEYLHQAMEEYVRKLIILKTDDRFAVGIFIKGEIKWNEDCDIHNNALVCSFMPNTSSGRQSKYRQSTEGYKIHHDDNTLEIFNGRRRDTFIFVTRPPEKSGVDVITSIALQKISKHVQEQCGRVNRAPVTTIEIHVISNRDRVAHQTFDLRFEHVQTEEYIRRLRHKATPYTPSTLNKVNWTEFPQEKEVFDSSAEKAQKIISDASENDLDKFMKFALDHRAEKHVFWIFESFLNKEPFPYGHIAFWMSQHPPLAFVILKKYLTEGVQELPPPVMGLATVILQCVIRSANTVGIAALVAIEKLAKNVSQLDVRPYIDLLWLASISIRSPTLVQEILMVLHECRGPARAQSHALGYVHKHALAVAFERAEEAADECHCDELGRPTKQRSAPIRTKLVRIKVDGEPKSENVTTGDFKLSVIAHVRVDAPAAVRIHSHVRLQVASPAEGPEVERAVVDAIVTQALKGEVRLDLMHPLPPEFESMDWNMYPAGSVATAKAMMDAIRRLTEGEECCQFSEVITRSSDNSEVQTHDYDETEVHDDDLSHLNNSQRRAVHAADSGFTLIWGPPGTGKTTVIVQILLRFLRLSPEGFESSKILMTASTHNAVDNVLERFIKENEKAKLLSQEHILRVATDGSKVAKALQQYTMDARVGGNINENQRLVKKAEKRLKDAVIVFTTCAGAGLGIMRKADFDTVLIDEASQVTEPCALIPLVKGCQRAVLVGDHVQLRPTVKPMGKALAYDVSLLERLYGSSNCPEVTREMLEVQYRFSDDIGRFPSNEFYRGRLRSGLENNGNEALRMSKFPWPEENRRLVSTVFVQCSAEEDYGRASKANKGQVELIRHIISLLQDTAKLKPGINETPTGETATSIAVLTPYSRQVTELRTVLPSDITTSTIDSFQGRESDVVIFSTVRCNVEGEIGFVEDARRLNVAWTRCKIGLIIVGDRRTLGLKSTLWQRAITSCRQVEITQPNSEE